MAISVFDLFKVGIGPSSSHTVGPMKAAAMFVEGLVENHQIEAVARIKVQLFGSLAATGKGHGSDKAVLMGLEGDWPDVIEPASIDSRVELIRSTGMIALANKKPLAFNEKTDLIMARKGQLPYHPNGMEITAYAGENELVKKRYYSVGGGFVVDGDHAESDSPIKDDDTKLTYPFKSAAELLDICAQEKMPISEVMLINESAWRSEQETREGLLEIWRVMQQCVKNGISNTGVLPGGLQVKRRAADMYKSLSDGMERMLADPLSVMDWVNLYALAVNEENAAGGRIVTAPTNGAAGIVPAVMHYYWRFCQANEDGIVRFLLTSGAIGSLYKQNASISGAEVGCQGEVGSACSMAAAGLCEVLGGTPAQVENAAEIAMEHNLGLTCDPIAGLVQVPCIERNAIASNKAINAVRMALRGDGTHFVSLDKVIKTMRDTGRDMKSKYKETARGGLAVNVIEC